MRFLLICAGGAIGTGARYLLSEWSLKLLGPAFPYGTLAVNLIGSFLLAAIMFFGLEAQSISPATRLMLGTGIMGGFTTYSTFSYDTFRFVEAGQWRAAILNVTLTLFGCLAACFAGWSLAKAQGQ